MIINNLSSTVPQQAVDLFYSYIPFGSEYYIYTSATTQLGGYNEFKMLLRRIGQDEYEEYTISRADYNSPYVISKSSQTYSYDNISVNYPYYSYSSEKDCGVVDVLPSTNNLICFCLIVVSLLAVLKTVFGGIKWVRSRKQYVV